MVKEYWFLSFFALVLILGVALFVVSHDSEYTGYGFFDKFYKKSSSYKPQFDFGSDSAKALAKQAVSTVKCVDTDRSVENSPGADLLVKGTTTVRDASGNVIVSATDVCADVVETACSRTYGLVKIPYVCSNGQSCVDGACVTQQGGTSSTNQVAASATSTASQTGTQSGGQTTTTPAQTQQSFSITDATLFVDGLGYSGRVSVGTTRDIYSIELVNIDASANTADLYVRGPLTGSSVPVTKVKLNGDPTTVVLASSMDVEIRMRLYDLRFGPTPNNLILFYKLLPS